MPDRSAVAVTVLTLILLWDVAGDAIAQPLAHDRAMPGQATGSSEAFVVDVRGSTAERPANTLYRAPLAAFTSQTSIGPTQSRILAMDFSIAGVLHGVTASFASTNPSTLGAIDLSTGAFTPIGPLAGLATGEEPHGLAIDARSGVAYLATSDGAESTLHTLNLATGAAAVVGSITLFPDNIDIGALAIGCDGVLYGFERLSDSLLSIDRTTGAATKLGFSGYSPTGASMDFDNASGALYGWLALGQGLVAFGVFNRTTGGFTPLANGPDGQYEGAVRSACPPELPLFANGFEG
ncbi:MAG TPA: hypothetical protein VND91_03380 [Candidatus Saccharimonadia bacterium]|nr:hypothetical protein [Candidatus Saccharimonadia bacterium]